MGKRAGTILIDQVPVEGWRIDRWDGSRIEAVLAVETSWDAAKAAWRVYCRQYPTSHLTWRQGARVIEEQRIRMDLFECTMCGSMQRHNMFDIEGLGALSCRNCGATATKLRCLGR